MREPSGTRSLWASGFSIPDRPPLDRDLDVDVCVIGGGIAGLTTAYLLAAARKRVALLEAGGLGGGETGRTTAHLTSVLDDGHAELERIHGREASRLAAESHAAAIDRIEGILRSEGIFCDYERLDGYLFRPPGGGLEELERELAAARRAGLDADWVRKAPLAGFDTGKALRFRRQAQLHPLKYLDGLASAAERRGARLFCGTRALKIEPGRPAKVRTDRGPRVRADAVVVATNAPFNDRFAIHNKQASYRTYVIAAPIERGKAAPALYWDTPDPYHYVRLQPGEGRGLDWLLVGGEDHETGHLGARPERFDRLYEWARERFPAMGAPLHRWSGEVREPADGLAFIGRNPADDDNVYVVTGDSGEGMTHGTIAGLLLRDLILGVPNPWSRLYDPLRVRVGAFRRWAGHGLVMTAQYGEYLLPGEVRSVDDIRPGSGAVIRRGVRRIAVYKGEDGRLIERSAVCRHLGGCVRWNGVEKTWDCPVHGSRYAVDGSVLDGPANRPLRTLEPARGASASSRRRRRPAAARRRPTRPAGSTRARRSASRRSARAPRR